MPDSVESVTEQAMPCDLSADPLKGGKTSQWEGGIRVNSWASGGFLPAKVRGTKYEGLATGWDWCKPPTFPSSVRSVRSTVAELRHHHLTIIRRHVYLRYMLYITSSAGLTTRCCADGTFSELAGIDPTDWRAAAANLPPVDSHSLVP